ncbi:MAG: pyrimidine 5'-nucleotidase [Anaerolineae bacterium]|nr:pyrimidine 5'-nucleotidase [Anaerolineae bacterium]
MSGVRYLLFDLDDTLYTNASGLFTEVGSRIEGWIATTLGLSPDEAKALRRRWFLTYGTAMSGLVHEHPELDVDAYLDHVHDIDVSRYLDPNPALAAMLTSLPAPKAVFTNSIGSWAEKITRQLGIRDCFEAIYDVRAVGYRSKPDPYAFTWVLQTLGLPGPACVMLDDQVSYLSGATAVGMRTILVRPGAQRTNGIEYQVDSVLEAEPVLRELLGE